jgi:hypothetical protein
MRAYEFISEGRKAKKQAKSAGPKGSAKPKNARGGTGKGKPRKEHEFPMQGVAKSRDVGGYDRVYHMNRIAMAMAMADGKSNKPVDMDEASWAEKFNTHHPYTKEEANMVASAINTVPTEFHQISDWSKSMETEDTNVSSPVTSFGGWGKKRKKSTKKSKG